jgi:TRAP-type mannitol/chloroaromatic compound transport system permease small subunit
VEDFKPMKKVVAIIEAMSEWSGKTVSFLITILALMVGVEVVARYVFNHPTEWSQELSAMVFGTFSVIGGAYTLRTNGHVNMDIIYQILPLRFRAFLDLCTSVLSFAFVGVLVWKGGESAWLSIKSLEHASTIWAPPIFPVKSMLPIGAFLLLLQLIAKFLRDLNTLKHGQEEE